MTLSLHDREQCRSGHLGIYLEQTGRNLAQLRSRGFTPENPGGGGPGIGVVSGLAGLLGAGWLASRRGE